MSTVSSTSSSTTSAYSSTSRITGLYSSLDTDSIVEDLLSTEQEKVDNVSKKKTYDEWYSEAVSDVVDLVDEFYDTYFSSTSDTSMLSSDTYYNYTVSTSDTSGAVSLTADSGAYTGSISVTVTTLAENAHTTGTTGAFDGEEIDTTSTLSELDFANALVFDDGSISFSINGTDFTFTEDTTLEDMMDTINADEDAGVTMTYSELTDSFTITADSGGADSEVKIENISGNAFGDDSAFMIDEGSYSNGVDASVTINGTTVTKDSNEFEIDGINYTLNDTTTSAVKFTVTRDYSATVDAVSDFIDAYNTLVESLTALVDEDDLSADYEPLTEAESEEMTDDEIEAWNVKAKTGILRNNSDIESLLSSIKNAFFTSVGGTGDTLTSIGITSGTYGSDDEGLLVLDEDMLTEALEDNAEKVISMFTNYVSDTSSSDAGAMYKIRTAITTYDDNAETDIDNTDDKVSDLEDKIEEMEDDLEDLAERYYAKFTAMETALATLNSESSVVTSLLGS